MSNQVDLGRIDSASYQPWSDVDTLSNLSVYFRGSDAGTASIFGNNLNQVEVAVSVRAVDKNSKLVNVSPNDVLNNTALVDYVTGDYLNFQNDKVPHDDGPWYYTSDKNNFCNVVQYSGTVAPAATLQDDDGTITLLFYVYWKTSTAEKDNGKQIAAAVSMADGRKITSCANTNFDSHKVVSIIPQKSYHVADLTQTTTNPKNGAWACTNYYWSISDNDFGCQIKYMEYDPALSDELYYVWGDKGDGGYEIAVNSGYPGACIYYASHRTNNQFYTNIATVWQMGDETTVSAPAGDAYDNYTYKTAVNEFPNSFCVTRNDQKLDSGFGNGWWTLPNQKNNLTIYDQFGNCGYFNFTVSGYEDPLLNDGHS